MALAYQCETVAFPLISSGVYGYPKDQALKVAVDTIVDFLLAHDITVYLVIFDRAAYTIGGSSLLTLPRTSMTAMWMPTPTAGRPSAAG